MSIKLEGAEGEAPMMAITSDGTEMQLSSAVNVSDLAAQQQLLSAAAAAAAAANGSLISATGVPVIHNPVAATMNFTDNNKSWDMLQFHRRARDHEKYCDCVLHVHGRQFLCHRLILASNSAYFDSIFQSRIAKAAATGPKSKNSQYYSKNPSNATRSVLMESLIISCTEPDVFQTFLNYMYTGNVTIDKSNVAELLRLSNNFMVLKLKEYCSEYLQRFLDAENCLQVKEVGDKYSIPSLSKVATQFVQNNLGEVINHEIMMELLPKQVESFLTEKAWSIPPDAAVKFMSRWVCHDIPARERDLKQLLAIVDWSLIDPPLIVDYIDQEPLYGSSERCFYYVLHSLAEKGIQVQKYEQMYQALQQRFGQEQDQPLGYGDNLLQMAFNSAMEGLQVPPDSSWSENRENDNKWVPEGEGAVKPVKKELSIDQKRKRILRRIQRNRQMKRWVVIRLDKPKSRKLAVNEMVGDSSGDEECDPVQDQDGYHCHLCPFTAKKVSKLERHLACIHAHDVTYRCSECGYTCKWNREYFLHMKTHFEGPPYKCANCSYSAPKIGSLMAHRVSHSDSKPHHCSECDFKSRTKANLAVHVKIHNNEKPYRCGICGRNFASKNSLDQHAVGHNTDKTYSCTQCPFSTKYLNHFTNHKKTHHVSTGKKGKELYRCSDSQCKYTTSKKSQLESHMRSHAGVRPHVCGICGRRFLEKSHLVRHERIHYNERPFKCEECDYASTRRDKLKEHKTRHHGVNASAKSPYKPRPHKGKSNGTSQSPSSSDQASPGAVVYAKKSSATSQSSQPATSQTAVVTQQDSGTLAAPTNEMEFIIPHTTAMTPETGAPAFAQLSQPTSIDLQQMTNAGIVQLRQYQPNVIVTSVAPSTPASVSCSSSVAISQSTVDGSSSSNKPTLVTFQATSSATASLKSGSTSATAVDTKGRKVPKSRFIIVQQGKPSETIQVAQTLASFPGAISAQDLQRTLGIKLEDLQAQVISGIPTSAGGAPRTIKLEELTGVQVAPGQGVTVNAQAIPAGARMPGTTAMVLDAAQLQQLASVAAQSGGFERGIPITISSIPVPSSVASNNSVSQSQGQASSGTHQGSTNNPQGSSQQSTPQQQAGSQSNDFSNLSNLFC